MTLTAVQIGNSVGVIIPADYRKKKNIKKGTKLDHDYTADGKLVLDTVSGAKKTGKLASVTPEFKEWLDSVNKEYGAALEELARK